MAGTLVTVDAGIATVTLDHPERRNALDATLAAEFIQTCDRLEQDPAVGAILLRGAGGYFCSGGDRGELTAATRAPLSDENMDRIGMIYEAFFRFGHIGVPTVAAIRGGAVGAGLNLALAADARIVAADARLVPGFSRLGYHPGGGHLQLLARAAGPDAAAAMGMMGATIDGRRAAEIGMAWEACADDQVEDRARDLLAPIAADPALARKVKSSYLLETRTPGTDWRGALQAERVAQLWSFARAGAISPDR